MVINIHFQARLGYDNVTLVLPLPYPTNTTESSVTRAMSLSTARGSWGVWAAAAAVAVGGYLGYRYLTESKTDKPDRSGRRGSPSSNSQDVTTQVGLRSAIPLADGSGHVSAMRSNQ